MVEITNPWLAGELLVCPPHVQADEETTESHDSHKMSGQSLNARASKKAG